MAFAKLSLFVTVELVRRTAKMFNNKSHFKLLMNCHKTTSSLPHIFDTVCATPKQRRRVLSVLGMPLNTLWGTSANISSIRALFCSPVIAGIIVFSQFKFEGFTSYQRWIRPGLLPVYLFPQSRCYLSGWQLIWTCVQLVQLSCVVQIYPERPGSSLATPHLLCPEDGSTTVRTIKILL